MSYKNIKLHDLNSILLPEVLSFFQQEESKFHSVWLQEMWDSCKSIFHNTCTQEQQDEISQSYQGKMHEE